MQTPTFKRAIVLFRTRCRELRQMHGFSYRELSERADINWRQLIAIENNERSNPTLVTLTRLADALGVEPYELIAPAQTGVLRRDPEGVLVATETWDAAQAEAARAQTAEKQLELIAKESGRLSALIEKAQAKTAPTLTAKKHFPDPEPQAHRPAPAPERKATKAPRRKSKRARKSAG